MQRAIGVWFQVACLVVFACAAGGAATAAAQDASKRIVVLDFEGAGAASVRDHVVSALSKRSEITLVPLRDAEAAAKRLDAALETPEAYVRVAEELDISAFVGGSLKREGRNFRATVWVRDGASGEVLHEEPWTRKKKPQLKTMRKNFWTVMGPHIEASRAPEKPKPVDDKWDSEPIPQTPAKPDQEAEPEEAPPSPASAQPALVLSLGPRMLARGLSYEGDTLGNLRTYSTKAAFAVAFGAQWYPAAHFRDGWLANIGLDVEGDYALALKSREGTRTVSTTAYELAGGLIARLPLDAFEPRLRLGYVRHVFQVDTSSGVFLPSMTYSAARLGVGTAIKIIEALSLDVGLGYLYVLDTGDLTSKEYFPKASVGAFEAGAGVLVGLTGPFAARAAIDWRRYFYDLKPNAAVAQPGGAKVADAATDDYLRLTVSFVYSIGGNDP